MSVTLTEAAWARVPQRHAPVNELPPTSDATRLLSQIGAGDGQAAEQFLPLVYNELRKLAAAKLAQEKPGQTLQATALVHEAYIRLVGGSPECSTPQWNSRGHFFAAAGEAMRRILIMNARRRCAEKRGAVASGSSSIQPCCRLPTATSGCWRSMRH